MQLIFFFNWKLSLLYIFDSIDGGYVCVVHGCLVVEMGDYMHVNWTALRMCVKLRMEG